MTLNLKPNLKTVHTIPPLALIAVPLILSAFTHLWNPTGFPTVQADEGIYMGRAMMVLKGLGLHEAITTPQHDSIDVFTTPYSHPFFGQIFLAGALGIISYPDSLGLEQGDPSSVELLYLAPRILMGLLAVADTFLIYKITEKRYSNNKRVAFVASVLFAVMPATWLLRRVWLDSIQLPLLLSSILFAVYLKESTNIVYTGNIITVNKKKKLLILLSGILLGLAIFTKIPAFTFIPLVGYMVFTSSNRSWKKLGMWFIPVIGIPMLWPAYAISIGDLDEWWEGVFWQAAGRIDKPLWMALDILFKIDPVLMVLGAVGILFAAVKRDFFTLLWVAPLLVLLQILGYASYWFFIPILPALAIGSGWIIEQVRLFIYSQKKQKVLLYLIISSISIFGLVSTIMLVTTELNSSYYKAVASIVKYVSPSVGSSKDVKDGITLVGNRWVPSFSWILNFVFPTELDYKKFYTKIFPIDTNYIILVVDAAFIKFLEEEQEKNEGLKAIYENTRTTKILRDDTGNFDRSQYPYTSMSQSSPIGMIELRTNFAP